MNRRRLLATWAKVAEMAAQRRAGPPIQAIASAVNWEVVNGLGNRTYSTTGAEAGWVGAAAGTGEEQVDAGASCVAAAGGAVTVTGTRSDIIVPNALAPAARPRSAPYTPARTGLDNLLPTGMIAPAARTSDILGSFQITVGT